MGYRVLNWKSGEDLSEWSLLLIGGWGTHVGEVTWKTGLSSPTWQKVFIGLTDGGIPHA
jgi:hypothetical protein